MKLYDDMIVTGKRIIAKSYAKINLSLDVLKRLDNGYHEVKMIMQSVNLFDLIIADKCESGISLSTNIKTLPTGEKNLAYRAADLFFRETGIKGGVKILVHKNIPIAAGLAGGSGNAAAVLCILNSMYDAGLNDTELNSLGLQLGADVPFCITGGTQLAEGIGEKLTPLHSAAGMAILLVKPSDGISTQQIYKKIDYTPNLVHPDTELLIDAISKKDYGKICGNLGNIMETVTIGECPEISRIKEQMLKLGADGALMSGSGPTVFGIFPDNISAKKALNYFSSQYEEVFLAHTI